MLVLDSFTMKVYDEKEEYLGERKTPFLNGFENIVEIGEFAHYEQMLHFPQYFQRPFSTKASKGVSLDYREKG